MGHIILKYGHFELKTYYSKLIQLIIYVCVRVSLSLPLSLSSLLLGEATYLGLLPQNPGDHQTLSNLGLLGLHVNFSSIFWMLAYGRLYLGDLV